MELNEFTWNLAKQIKFELFYNNAVDHCNPYTDFYSDWHIENVLEHTLMVLSHAKNKSFYVTRPKELLLAAAYHDSGKPLAINYDATKNKVSFYGHAGISNFRFCSTDNYELNEDQFIFISRLISYHDMFFDITDKSYNKLKSKFLGCDNDFMQTLAVLVECDGLGSFSKISAINWGLIDKLVEDVYTEEPLEEIKSDKKAIIMCGLPGSGKSTYVKTHYNDYTVISRDNELMKLANTDNYNETWNQVDQEQVDKNFTDKLNESIKNNENIVIDRTNLTYKGRKKFIDQLKANGYEVTIVLFCLDYYLTLERNKNRKDKTIDNDVIVNMMKTFVFPFPSEGKLVIIKE